MDFLMQILIESFVQDCKPYACFGPNARPSETVEERSVVIDGAIIDTETGNCRTWREGIEMTCEQAIIWDNQNLVERSQK